MRIVNNDAYEDLVGGTYDNRLWVRLGNAGGFDAAITTLTNYAVNGDGTFTALS